MIIKSRIDFKRIPVKGDLLESVESFISSNSFKPNTNRKVFVEIKVNVTELRKFKKYLGGDGKYKEKAELLKACNKIKFPKLKGYKVKFVYKDTVKVAPKKKAVVKKKVVKKTSKKK